ncbi:ROK family protein [Thermodesulfitimonas sp.]
MTEYIVGVDLGGTKIRTALATLDGEVRAEVEVPTGATAGYTRVIEQIAGTIEEVRQQAGFSGKPLRVGLGAPGPLDPQKGKGIVHVAPNLGWRNVPLAADLAALVGAPVLLENDANLAAVGEFAYGAGKGVQDMVYITVSTGIGGGLILGGRLYRGAGYGAGEIGHITLLPDGPLCSCGNRGCLEALASGTAVARQARELIGRGGGRGILTLAGGVPETVTAKMVAEAACQGDGEAKALFAEAARWLGIGIAAVVNLLNPAVVVLGGGMMKSAALFWGKLEEEVTARTLPGTREVLRLKVAELGGRSGVLGAVAYALRPE